MDFSVITFRALGIRTEYKLVKCSLHSKLQFDYIYSIGIVSLSQVITNFVHPYHQDERDMTFEWFTSLMGDDPDLHRDSIYKFFIENILQYNTTKLNQGVIFCFSSFFAHIHEQAMGFNFHSFLIRVLFQTKC